MAKLTIPVKPLLEQANSFLKSSNFSKEEKAGICTMIERVLHDSGNYSGFMFLRNVGTGVEVEAPRPNDNDYFDRVYFESNLLRKKILK